MKKYYIEPMIKMQLFAETDVITLSAGTLVEGENENENQWWLTINNNF